LNTEDDYRLAYTEEFSMEHPLRTFLKSYFAQRMVKLDTGEDYQRFTLDQLGEFLSANMR
jgi:hypothetical protein